MIIMTNGYFFIHHHIMFIMINGDFILHRHIMFIQMIGDFILHHHIVMFILEWLRNVQLPMRPYNQNRQRLSLDDISCPERHRQQRHQEC
jgi:hypothetical protein